jgi:hypothetical protein
LAWKLSWNVLKSTLRPISFFLIIIINQWIEFNFENVKYISTDYLWRRELAFGIRQGSVLGCYFYTTRLEGSCDGTYAECEQLQRSFPSENVEVHPEGCLTSLVRSAELYVYITQRNPTKFGECSIPPQNLMEYP